ncbi:hypothetical protein PPL_05044 [Heterostelium album PN500]|uniref:Uncharacterized protein n=1 Tax=Heterostelium pallidum (strain ATCC 26659 / Pp 5 / PN500) TaxID=670386 RepID=D3B9A0_HETP5|nr:hypothetical protein PPL_05044 [Heterostelium album PN500]EFA82139.1 hypothetical protein PPL_05044 [Heterostelium album PN500]|eukprot:XP_020434256.1 hypothetical protein PPL_05044 [Heterostelium album PN500]
MRFLLHWIPKVEEDAKRKNNLVETAPQVASLIEPCKIAEQISNDCLWCNRMKIRDEMNTS